MKVVSGPASIELGEKVSENLGVHNIPLESKVFPDGESYLRYVEEIRDEEVVLVQTTSPPQDTRLVQLLLLIDAAKKLGAEKVTAVVPYLAYARQDKVFRSGEVVSAKAIARLIEAAGADVFFTVNIHAPSILDAFNIPAHNLSAITELAQYFKRIGLEDALSLAPDIGAVEIAAEADKVLGGGYGYLRKERDRVTGEIAMEDVKLNVEGRNAIVFDDIISTGGTTAAAVKILKNQGAKRVFAACVHPLMIGEAEKRILENGAEGIIGTDCVKNKFSQVSVAPVIASAVSRID
ncbi:MAG: ribose-phosphate diphosphokinase [Candidatus Bathyarchaeota archaeon]|nr:MAG: ribose-phosphate diphosphokinase [Candidatus Bathyarchaeota archaeon]